jgi:hypothetical protein
MPSLVPPPGSATHTLSLSDVDELNHLHGTILRRITLIGYVLDDQKSQGPRDDSDHPMLTILREALQELVNDIRAAAVESAAIMARADERRRSHAEKGGA